MRQPCRLTIDRGGRFVGSYAVDTDMKKVWIPQAIVIPMLLWALIPANPYGYYILLRWICCAAFAYLAINAWGLNKIGWVWVLGVTAAIYNPNRCARPTPRHCTRMRLQDNKPQRLGLACSECPLSRYAPAPLGQSSAQIVFFCYNFYSMQV